MLTFSVGSVADVAIIVNPNNDVQYNEEQIRNVFLGKIQAFPNGGKIHTYTLPIETSEREQFVASLIKRSESSLHSYWSRMLFSAKARPPKVLPDTPKMKEQVSTDVNAIGFIQLSDVDDSVRVLQVLKRRN